MAPVIVTRAGVAGRALADRLRARHADTLWWPAFDIFPARDVPLAETRLKQLAKDDLALFVSVHAVHATRELLAEKWPPTTVIGAVGASTRAAARLLPGADAVPIIAPEASDEPGSEGWWRAWLASGRSATRALVLRAEHGREWLIERLRETGSDVEALAVYRRETHRLAAEELGRIEQWIGVQAAPVVLFTSTEAVSTLEQAAAQAGTWLRSGIALATHARIADALRRTGYSRVITIAPDDDAVVGTLESLSA